MSNRRHARNAKNGRHRGGAHTPDSRIAGPGETYLIVPAVHTNRHQPGVEAELRKLTHDQLYAQAAEGQVLTGVWWSVHYGAEALERYQKALEACGMAPATQVEADEYGVQLEGNPELLLVIAWAIGVAPS